MTTKAKATEVAMFKLNRITLSIRWAINFNNSSPGAIDSAEAFYINTGDAHD